ncbi:inner membrane protein [Lewinella aquimaris]|uniref:Inner membrane protein n=1 Tax=Neolewinella aquimaris TaxID=1835722 RepID=A0A840EDX1_9BACT|nr:metal-dependent hydrolase [Neolewinella aquimaris]MBB4079136.1 inner membrane protein [Neolewinella aquimaris]
MDSLTQVILGAAVGEAVLGRKLGNRAMLWGGIAGTLPDLDVLSGLVTDPMSALAYHRAFTHSLPFAILAGPLIGWTVHRLHADPPDKRRWIHILGGVLAFWVLLTVGSYAMPIPVYGVPGIAAIVTAVFAGMCAIVGWWSLRVQRSRGRIHVKSGIHVNPKRRQWILLFFLAIVTHPLLDCFTAYGTQFFEPFAATRLAWNTVSVVDPLYTLPFLLLLILAARSGRGTQERRKLNTAGLVVSSAYLLLTTVNHFNVRSVLGDTIAAKDIVAQRTLQGPTLGNNLLWTGLAQTGSDTFYVGEYSLLDERRTFEPMLRIDGRHDLLAPYHGDRELDILRWFSNGIYSVTPVGGGRVQLNDLRYGLLGDDPDDPTSYLFNWQIDTTVHPVRVMPESEEAQAERGERMGAFFGELWDRMLGE